MISRNTNLWIYPFLIWKTLTHLKNLPPWSYHKHWNERYKGDFTNLVRVLLKLFLLLFYFTLFSVALTLSNDLLCGHCSFRHPKRSLPHPFHISSLFSFHFTLCGEKKIGEIGTSLSIFSHLCRRSRHHIFLSSLLSPSAITFLRHSYRCSPSSFLPSII